MSEETFSWSFHFHEQAREQSLNVMTMDMELFKPCELCQGDGTEQQLCPQQLVFINLSPEIQQKRMQ